MVKRDFGMISQKTALHQLLRVVDTLFGSEGCAWVKTMNLDLLQQTLVEEVHEVIAACAQEDWNSLADELGDLLYNVLCLVKVAAKEGSFSESEPFLRAIAKFTRRNPHVFSKNKRTLSPVEVERQWLEMKKLEKQSQPHCKSDVERAYETLPSLSFFSKFFEIASHDHQKQQAIVQVLKAPAASDEELLAQEFLSLAQRAYEKNVSLEKVGKSIGKKVLTVSKRIAFEKSKDKDHCLETEGV